jgi:Domain of unknown function (DUF4189)
MLGKWLVIGGTVLTSLICGSIENASAYWQCPVGVEPGGPNNSGIACYWVEEPQQQNDPGPAPDPGPSIPTMYANSYIAVAWHNNADDVWAIWNHRAEAKAKESALNACNQVMGSGCTIAGSSWNTSVAIARRQNGQIWYATESTPKKAQNLVMKSCEDANNDCKLLHTFTAEPLVQPANFTPVQQEFLITNPAFDFSKKYFPSTVKRLAPEPLATGPLSPGPQADTSRGFFAIAWLKGKQEIPFGNLVVASGFPTIQDAEKAALERCQAQSQQPCISSNDVDDQKNPMFGIYLNSRNHVQLYNHTTAEAIEKAAEAECSKLGLTCKKVGIFDVRRSDVSIHRVKQ